MSDRDLTRWNRAGLSRFRYMDGNVATYLERLRCAFADPDRFPNWENVAQVPAGETASERLLEQYYGDRRDWTWEIGRVLARSSHVLTEYIDAYANEGFLGTATQWDNVRRLVEMLDYHPAPPASASTVLVLEAKKGVADTAAAGFQVKYSPADGSAPVVFETLEDIDIDAVLNQLRPAEYDRNQDSLSGTTLFLEGQVEDLKTGEPLVLEDEKTGVLRTYLIQGTQLHENATEVKVSPRLSHQLTKGYVKVHAKPKERLDPVGPAAKGAEIQRVLRVTEEPEGLLPGMVVWISDGKEAYFRRLTHVRGKRLVFDSEVGILRLDQARVGRPVVLNVSEQVERPVDQDGNVIYAFKTAGDWSRLANQKIADHRIDDQGKKCLAFYTVTAARYHPADPNDPNGGYTILTISDYSFPLNNPQTLLVPPAVPGEWTVDTYLEKVSGHLPVTITTSVPKKTSAGDIAVVVTGSQPCWARLASVAVDQDKEKAELTATGGWEDRGGSDFFLGETTVYGHFKEELRLQGWQKNDRSLTGTRIPLAKAPDCLEKGRTILVESADDPTAAFFTMVAKTEGKVLSLSQDLPAGFTYGNCLIAGNVVLAGHGEIRGEKVLGSGDATQSSQSFVFEQENVSFVPDATQPSGVRATVEVRVEGRTWQQVGSLNDSGPADPHYTVRMTERECLKIAFGDGAHGRRLPSGSNNVRLTYRVGAGLEGNLPAGSLTKPAKPHRLVKAVRQPMAATGGNDMEGVESLRENAPATLLTLERAVSLTDFAYLAMSQSSVWQARAFSRPTGLGRNEKIEVVVVPSGGGDLGALGQTLTEFLLARAIPGVEINVLLYQPRTFALDVLLSVNTEEYDPEDVASGVKTELEETFSLEKRKLGQDLFLSEVYEVVESVTGVEHSQVIINGDRTVRKVPADDHEVLTAGQILVDYEGSGTITAPSGLTPIDTEPRKLIGRRSVQVIQGVGSRYTAILRNLSVRTLEDLQGFDPDRTNVSISRVRLWEFKTKAGVILGFDMDQTRLAFLLDRSLLDLAHSASADLVRQSGETTEFIEELKTRLRLLQIAMDEKVFGAVTLRELVTELS